MMKKITAILILLLSLNAFAQEIVLRDSLYYKGNELYTGRLKESKASGNVLASLSIRKGQLHGKSLLYHENGKAKELRTYRKGLKHGSWYSWNEQGIRIAGARYSAGLKHGKWLIWDENGQIRYIMHYKKGLKSGTWFMFDAKGEVIMKKTF